MVEEFGSLSLLPTRTLLSVQKKVACAQAKYLKSVSRETSVKQRKIQQNNSIRTDWIRQVLETSFLLASGNPDGAKPPNTMVGRPLSYSHHLLVSSQFFVRKAQVGLTSAGIAKTTNAEHYTVGDRSVVHLKTTMVRSGKVTSVAEPLSIATLGFTDTTRWRTVFI